MAANVTGSVEPTPKRRPDMTRVSASAPARPVAMPIAVRRSPCLRMSIRTGSLFAGSDFCNQMIAEFIPLIQTLLTQ